MDTGSFVAIVVVAFISIVVFYVIGIYNKLVNSKNIVNHKWQAIDKLLEDKIKLIGKLVEVIKKYAMQEEALLMLVLTNRNRVDNAISINDKIEANKRLDETLNELINLDKNYEKLNDDDKYKSLIQDINNIDSNIDYAKEFYNKYVVKHNKMLEKFPINVIAKSFNFKTYELFKQ